MAYTNTSELFIDKKLPAPLKSEEFYSLMELVKQGNTAAREKVILHNIRLVISEVTSHFEQVNYDKKDLVQIGCIGLIKAVESFDTTRPNLFSTYAKKCIDNEIYMFLRQLKKDKNTDSLDRVITGNNDKDKDIQLQDTLYSDINIEEEYMDEAMKELIKSDLEELPDREREVIMLRFGFYNDKIYTQAEIAEMFEISQSGVCKIVKRGLKKLTQKLNSQDIISTPPKKSPSKQLVKVKS